jgi:sugar phosphate isomerase/epimerase
MPRLAAFPKAFIRDLCAPAGMNLQAWVDLAAPLRLDGLEFYSGFRELADPARWSPLRRMVESAGMVIPMLCCSPDFSACPIRRRAVSEIEREKGWIRMAADAGCLATAACSRVSAARSSTAPQGLDLVVSAHRGVPAGGGGLRGDADPGESLQG